MRTLLRAAAVAVASTALVAGTATMASAAPGDTSSVPTAAFQAAATSGSKNVKTTFVPGTVAVSTPHSSSYYGLKATVNVNGVPRASGVTIGRNGFYYDRSWGSGVVTLTNFTLSGQDNRPGQPNSGYYTDQLIAGASNPFRVRYGFKLRDGFTIRKVGKKMTFKVKARYVDNRGKSIGIRKATIQVKKGNKWKTLKKVKLKKNGTATFKRSDKKKRKYRMVVKSTNTYQGITLHTSGGRKI